jgi:hypothetical protein
MEERDDDLQSVIDRALRRASLPASSEAQAGIELHAADPPAPTPVPFDDGD